ncbi:MAG: dipeptidase, partial [Bacteroidales bacterium]|nr:dipeptidase [Bacteroidales bacterium]
PTSAFWQISKVTHFAYLFYDRVAPVIRAEIDKYAAECHNSVAATDSEAMKLLNSGKKAEMVSLLTSATDKLATKMFNRWKELENELLVKFIDGNVKRQDENGKYLVNHESTIPASPEHPAQRERWLRAIVNDNGKTLKANE